MITIAFYSKKREDSTDQRLFAGLTPGPLQQCLISGGETVAQLQPGEVRAINGKHY